MSEQKSKSIKQLTVSLVVTLLFVTVLFSFVSAYPPVRTVLHEKVVYTVNAADINQNYTSNSVGEALSAYLNSRVNASNNVDSDVTFSYYVENDSSVQIIKFTPTNEPVIPNAVSMVFLIVIAVSFVAVTAKQSEPFIESYLKQANGIYRTTFKKESPPESSLLEGITTDPIEVLKNRIPPEEKELRPKAIKLKQWTLTSGKITGCLFGFLIAIWLLEAFLNDIGVQFSTYGAFLWLFLASLGVAIGLGMWFVHEDTKRFSDNHYNNVLRYFLEHGNMQGFEEPDR